MIYEIRQHVVEDEVEAGVEEEVLYEIRMRSASTPRGRYLQIHSEKRLAGVLLGVGDRTFHFKNDGCRFQEWFDNLVYRID
ncbi:uncharacterized protein A4U43_C03F6750 [Asparagus officinalis]|uniref:Uncharacterized protein n=1 Tax=Asparagus officinalis TaxID=4686 RepID=A0A5P1F8N8_ASPOF|nr:uncharacterized protein A4U43_C03F6750 [Asparagus officinalis]